MLLISEDHLKQFIQEQNQQLADEVEELRSMTIRNFETQGNHFTTKINQLEETMETQTTTTETTTTSTPKAVRPSAKDLREFAFDYERRVHRGIHSLSVSRDPSELEAKFIDMMSDLKAAETVAAAKAAGMIEPEKMSTMKKVLIAGTGTLLGAAAIYGVARKVKSARMAAAVTSPQAPAL